LGLKGFVVDDVMRSFVYIAGVALETFKLNKRVNIDELEEISN